MTDTKELRHKLTLRYVEPAKMRALILALAPIPTQANNLISQTLSVDPQPSTLSWIESAAGGRLAKLSFDEPVENLCITSTLNLKVPKTFDFTAINLPPSTVQFPFEYDRKLSAELSTWRILPNADEDLVEVLKSLPNSSLPTLEALNLINDQVATYLENYQRFDAKEEEVKTQHANLLVKTFRAVKLAARYAIGYDLSDEDKASLCTSAQAYIPGHGWLTFNQDACLGPDQFISLKIGADLASTHILPQGGDDYNVDHEIQTQNISKEQIESGQTHSAAATKSEGMAKAASKVDRLLKSAKLEVASLIEVRPSEDPKSETNTSWPALVSDLKERLEATKLEGSPRLHNLHYMKGKNAAEIAQRARFLTLAFPSLTRLIGLERFEGPYLTAQDEALQTPATGSEAIYKTRHDFAEPFHSLPNALLERAVLARLTKGSHARFAPKSNDLLNDGFRLPSFLLEDIRSLCSWLTTADLQIDANWFQAHYQGRYPLQQTLIIPSESASKALLEIRPAYRSGPEQHQFSLFEFKLGNDHQDRFDVAVDGWTLPLKRFADDKLAAVKTSDLFTNLDVSVYDKWQKETVLTQGFRVSNGAHLNLCEVIVKDRRMVSPPPHPDLSYTLDLAWAKHWGGSGRRF